MPRDHSTKPLYPKTNSMFKLLSFGHVDSGQYGRGDPQAHLKVKVLNTSSDYIPVTWVFSAMCIQRDQVQRPCLNCPFGDGD